MGCTSSAELPLVRFADTFEVPDAIINTVQNATFTDIWYVLNNNDWSRQSPDKFKEKLRVYMKLNVCMEKHIVIQYKGKSWIFNTEYNDSNFKNYRILKF